MRTVFFILVIVLLAVLVYAPPTPHSIDGYIFTSTKQVSTGTDFKINVTNSSDFLRSKTSVPIPSQSGRYFETINGTDNDTVFLFAWNITHYGIRDFFLNGTMRNINVTLNISRNAETNVTILSPANSSLQPSGVLFYLNASIQVLGASGTLCNATLNFSNSSVVLFDGSDSGVHELGSLSIHQVIWTNWTLAGGSAGSTNITLTAECAEKGVNLENRGIFSLKNITVIDASTPNITLLYPLNNTLNISSKSVTFYYNVTDGSAMSECRLVINGVLNASNTSAIVRNQSQNISTQLENSNYSWSVRCVNILGTAGNSLSRNISIAAYAPKVESVIITSPIDLEAGTTKRITCNASVSDGNGGFNISTINATFFHSGSTHISSEDNNSHYTNSTCINTSTSATLKNFSCSFNVWYYANNDTWTCNITALDLTDFTNHSANTTRINTLLAISTDSSISYGFLQPEGPASDDINLSVFNYGNARINISVDGYGSVDGDGNATTCFFGSINLSYQRYSIYHGTAYNSMTTLTDIPTIIPDFTLYQRVNDTGNDIDTNKTYWKMSIPQGVRGPCTGTIVFTLSVN